MRVRLVSRSEVAAVRLVTEAPVMRDPARWGRPSWFVDVDDQHALAAELDRVKGPLRTVAQTIATRVRVSGTAGVGDGTWGR